MLACKTIEDYLETVAQQIRWKRARPVVVQELAQHMEEQRDTFAESGMEDAEQRAVEEMGDPVSVGLELDALHRPKPQWGLLILTIGLALAGAVLRIQLRENWIDPVMTMTAFLLGCGALFAGYFLDYGFLARHSVAVYLTALAAGIFSLLCSKNVNGASYYTRYIVLCYPVVYAFWLYFCRGKGWKGLILAIAGGIPPAVICTLTPYLFALLMLLVVGGILLGYAAWRDWFGIGAGKTALCVGSCVMVLCGILVSIAYPHYAERVAIMLHPERDWNSGYLAYVVQTLLQYARWYGEADLSQWWECGEIPSQYVSQNPYSAILPNCESDNFLTMLLLRFGWLPFLAIVLIFTVLLVWLLIRCLRHKSQVGQMIALSVIVTLGLQALGSLAVNLGYPLFSATFPLVIGNLHTVFSMGMIGLALSVFRGESIDSSYVPRRRIHRISWKPVITH